MSNEDTQISPDGSPILQYRQAGAVDPGGVNAGLP
ncbi:hypothetical protein FHR56_003556 [Xanthomonas sacchari]|nr:hypothetical protein [Xanthomonas sp. F10]